MNNAATQESFSDALAQIAKKDLSRQRFALALTIAMTVAAACWLGFSAWQVHKLNRQSIELASTDKELSDHIRIGNKILAALVPLLKDFGWPGDKIPKDLKDVDRITRSVEADDELTRIRFASNLHLDRNIAVQYFRKDIDGTKVSSALKEFGIQFIEKPPLVTDLPVNDVVFGDNVSLEDAKIVAYMLIRAGVDVKGIHRSNYQTKAMVVEVIANRIVADGQPLSVDAIRQMSSFDLDPI